LYAIPRCLAEKNLRQRGIAYKKIYVHRSQHAGYFPGAHPMTIKLLFTPTDGKILGAQIVGVAGVDKRIDVLATAQQAGLTVTDLEDLELAYAPQYGSAKDPVNVVGYVASNALRGDEDFIDPAELDDDARPNWTILDVREPREYEAGHIPGAVLIPLGQLRARWEEIPNDKPLVVYCAVGQRAYYATRILRAKGLHPRNLAGGFTMYSLCHAQPPVPGTCG